MFGRFRSESLAKPPTESALLVFQKVPWIFEKFHRTADVYRFIDELNGYDRVDVFTIGRTRLGTPLKIVRVKSDDPENRDTVWVDGGRVP